VIAIDVSKVPSDKQTRQEFLNLKSQMAQALAQKQWINAFCIHEAGHMFYLTQIGVTEYSYLGPRIVYNQLQDNFDGYMASVQPQAADFTKNTDPQKLLITAAKAYAAGSAFTKKLTGAPDQGDQEDRENLDNMCDLIQQKFSGFVIDREASWKQAQEDVLRDLRSPEFRAKAWEKAREIQGKLFGI
jgi:hypothetical protein